MKRLLLSLGVTFTFFATSVVVACGGPAAEANMNTTPDGRLVRAGADEAATYAAALDAFEAAFRADSLEIHSVMVLHHGRVVAERWWAPGAPDSLHILNSVSKSFTAAAVGFAVAEGLISLDDRVVGFFPDKLSTEPAESAEPAGPSPHLAAMTVRNLLTMSTGQAREPRWQGEDWVGHFLSHPVDEAPGTTFRYNSMATFMLSAIVQKVSGMKLTDYLEPRLFAPLGIAGYRWLESPEGINTGGWGLYIRTEDMAKFGQLFLQNGVWNGVRLLPVGWVAEASARQISSSPAGTENLTIPDSDWTQGYGYQMWRSRHNSYRADGANGQYILVLPDQDAVVAVTAHLRDMQAELNLIWKHILPSLTPAL